MQLNKIHEIIVPQLSVNDDFVFLLSYYYAAGEKINSGAIIAGLETSKTALELESEKEGYFYPLRQIGDKLLPGTVLALVLDSKDETILAQYKENHQSTHSMTQFASPVVCEHPASNKLIIIGGGGHAKMCIDIIRQNKQFEIHGIIDNHLPVGTTVLGVPVIGNDNDLPNFFKRGILFAINGIGAAATPSLREAIYLKIKQAGFIIPNIIHPRASIEPSAYMGEGNQIMANAAIGSDARLGNNIIINAGAVVSHDSIISDHASIAPGAILAGKVQVGKNTLIGMGVTVYFNTSIGKNVIIHNGCHVKTHIGNDCVVKEQ